MIWSLLLYCFWDFHLCRIGHYYICDTLIKSAFQKYFEGKKSTLILWFWKALSKCKSFINFQVTTTKIKWCLLYIALAFLDLNSLSWCAPHWMSNVAYSVQKKKKYTFLKLKHLLNSVVLYQCMLLEADMPVGFLWMPLFANVRFK